MKPERCQAVSKSGSPCNATPVPGDTLCAWHSPRWEERRREWSRKGGAGRSNKARARKQIGADVLTLGEVEGLLSLAIRGVLAGRLEPGIGNAVANLARAIALINEAGDVQARLDALEARAGVKEMA